MGLLDHGQEPRVLVIRLRESAHLLEAHRDVRSSCQRVPVVRAIQRPLVLFCPYK